uniref:Uncharacterized protein n=1 Tax=Timema douglasi TaxID=61478 RepID=A0A7R8VGD8_TIMDO|nr:unnamed protein product [Timema douglasi]
MASLVLTNSSQLTSDNQHLGIYSSPVASLVLTDSSQSTFRTHGDTARSVISYITLTLNRGHREDENKMDETDAPHCNGDVIPSIDEEYQDSEEETSLMGEVKKISVQSIA